MPDFSQLLKRPAGSGAKPLPIPGETYLCVITKVEHGKGYQDVPVLRLILVPTEWPDSIPEDQRGQMINGEFVPTDLSKRQLRKELEETDEKIYLLDKLMEECGIAFDGRSYEELVPELVGKMVYADVVQKPNKDLTEVYNNVNRVRGLK